MNSRHFLMILATSCFFGCSSSETSNKEDLKSSNEWELQIVDSIQVDYLGTVDGGDFKNGKGIIFNFQENKLIEFNEKGEILNEVAYPIEGPGSVNYPSQLRYTNDGKLFAASFISWLYKLNSDLSLNKEIKLSFLSQSNDGGGLLRNLDYWNNYIITWFPGRDGANPFDPFFFRDHYLLEKINAETGDSEAIIKIPPTSRYATDNYYERPWVQFGITNDLLFLTLSNEPKVHAYDLEQGGKYVNTIDFKPSKFLDNGEHEKEYQYISGSKMRDGEIRQLFSTAEGNIVIFSEGIDEDIFAQNQLNTPEHFRESDNFQKVFLKIIQQDSTLSNEIEITRRIGRILNIESLSKPFYALRNDEFLGEEQDYLTFYKLKLIEK